MPKIHPISEKTVNLRLPIPLARLIAGALVLAGIIWATPCAEANCLTLRHTIHNPTQRPFQEFGQSVSIWGNDMLIGAPDLGGAAYLYDTRTGTITHSFANPTPQGTEYFGWSVALSGVAAVIGAMWDNTGADNAGSVYVFEAAGGALLHSIHNPTPSQSDEFGRTVAISGNRIVVGAPYDSTAAQQSGSAYVFDATTGALLHTLPNPTGRFGALFGMAVAISGDHVVVSAPYEVTSPNNIGVAHLFDAATGALVRTLNKPAPASDRFGWAVAVSGNNILIGAPDDNTGIYSAGKAYLMDATSGALLRSFSNPTPVYDDDFGSSLAISGNNILIGDFKEGTAARYGGIAYFFDGVSGALLQTLNNPAPAEADVFGRSVALSGAKALIGAENDDDGAESLGGAYLFECTPPNAGLDWGLYE